MVEIKERIVINVDDSEFTTYRDVLKYPEWGTNANLKLFTATVLIGKYIVGKPLKLDKRHTYLRVRDNATKDDMAILKCFAVIESNNINILKDEDAMFTICEEYANSGIKKLKEWYEDKTQDIDVILSNVLVEKFNENENQFFNNLSEN